jgi:NAD(P)H-hydrate epimerase
MTKNKLISILNATQIKEADQYTITNEPISSSKLMERAAFACFKWIEQRIDFKQYFVLFCGTGNNGGDGLALAKLLNENKYLVQVFVFGKIDTGSTDFKYQFEIINNTTDIKIHHIESKEDFPPLNSGSVVIDALFGTGLNRPLEGLSSDLVRYINSKQLTVISIDIPSGLFCEDNSNNSIESIVQATYTLTFERTKLSFLLADFGEKAGQWEVVPIGLNQAYLDGFNTPYYLITKGYVKSLLKTRNKFSHKGTYGHSLLISGSHGKMGAAILATKAALHSGVGLVTTLVPQCGYEIMQTSCPEAMCLTSIEYDYLVGDFDYSIYQSIGVGPGIGNQPGTSELVLKILQQATCPLILDADALNILSQNKDWLRFLPKNAILTPHPKEFDRLFGKCETAFQRLNLQIQKSKDLNCYILLKGAHSSLSNPTGEVFFNSTGNPGMAKGGSGDVLTGMIASLLAQEYKIQDATLLGIYLHGLAGDQAKEKYTEYAMNATQLKDYIHVAYSILIN